MLVNDKGVQMLTAINNEKIVIARDAQKPGIFTCPECGEVVTLRKGSVKVHHLVDDFEPKRTGGWIKGDFLIPARFIWNRVRRQKRRGQSYA